MKAQPGTGGVTIPPDVQARTRERVERFAAEQYAGKYLRLDTFIDTAEEGFDIDAHFHLV